MIQESAILAQNFLVSREYLETIYSRDGLIRHLSYHQQRLNRVLQFQKTPKTHDLHLLLQPPENGLFRCRVLYDEYGCLVSYLPYKERSVERLKLVYSDTVEYSKKYADRSQLEELFAQRGECDDVLIVKNGYITDTTIANVALSDGKIWYTPKRALLNGTTRERLLQESKIVQRDIRLEEIYSFKKIALMNAMIDFAIIASDNIEDVIC